MTNELRESLFAAMRRALEERVAFVGITFEKEAQSPICVFRNVEADSVLLADVLRQLADQIDDAADGGRIENVRVPLVQ